MELVLILVLLSSVWVASDVRSRRAAGKTDDSAWSWFASCVLLWIVAFPAYLWSRSRPAPEKNCPDCAERVNAAARVCRYCHHSFAAPAGEPVSARGRA